MVSRDKSELLRKIVWLRVSQLIVNQKMLAGEFKIPIHLALGHEAIAAAVDFVLRDQDSLFLTHRNIHYNLARVNSLQPELDEYYLKKSGLAGGRLGSMNLSNPSKGIVYSSSILGNNLSVGSGYALGNKVKNNDSVVFIVTGDGAIEEGAFYESLMFLKSHDLPAVILIENNEWSLATKIAERRCDINLSKIAESFGLDYLKLANNDSFDYSDKIDLARFNALKYRTPVLMEVELTTLGHWTLINEEHPEGKFINYHGGSSPSVELTSCPMLEKTTADPLYMLLNTISLSELEQMCLEVTHQIQEELK